MDSSIIMHKCIFLDRDGVINRERGDYTYSIQDFEILPGVKPALQELKSNGYLLVVVTNQSGISQGLYTLDQMRECHNHMQKMLDHLIDEIYYSPYHPSVTESLSRKPDNLLFQKAIAKFGIDPLLSWMIGDRERDLIPAKNLGMRTILVGDEESSGFADFKFRDLASSKRTILGS